jgi:general secretion pathway protein I
VKRPGHESGFSLLEVLVAFSILAMALTALLSVFGGGLRLASVADDTALATSFAQSKLAEVGVVEPLSEGQTSGAFDERFRWIVDVRPQELADKEIDSSNLPVQLYRVDVRVEWDEGKRTRAINLTTFRIAAEAG